MIQKISLNDRQIAMLLAVIDICTEESVSDNFWDEQLQEVAHYDEKGNKVLEPLQTALDRLLDPEKLDI